MTVFIGYPAQIFEIQYSAIAWLSSTLNTTDPIVSVAAINAVYGTLRNGLFAIGAWQTQNALQGELVYLQEIQSLNLSLTSPTQTLFDARIAAVEAMIADLGNYIPQVNPPATVSTLSAGNLAIPYTGIVEGWAAAAYEAVPAGTTADTLVAQAQAEVAAWIEVSGAVLTVQGVTTTGALDAANRMQAVSLYAATLLYSLESGGFDESQTLGASDPSTLWNQLVALPSLYQLAAVLFTPPHLVVNQECGAIRYAIGVILDNLSLLLLTLRKAVYSTISLAKVKYGDTLMDIAARELNDYSRWVDIATLNGLSPPWTGPNTGDPTIASTGQQILLPSSAGQQPTATGYPVPSYTQNVLGVDIYLGPLGQSMLSWTGDFQTIAGYANLQLSLGRRLQTRIGDLIYHSEFGSRIPPEVGGIQQSYELSKIAAYASSALLSDPRVSSIVSCTATAPAGGNSLVNVVAVVQPIGYGVTPVLVNETLAPSANAGG